MNFSTRLIPIYKSNEFKNYNHFDLKPKPKPKTKPKTKTRAAGKSLTKANEKKVDIIYANGFVK